LRDGKLRVSPHLYNSSADIDAAIDVLTASPRLV
jgi:selenocysteine lyase/cysteine desulfurase